MTADPDPPEPVPPRLTMRAFWRDFGDEALSLDRGLPWTFARLCVAPGRLIRRYVDWRDPRIVRPARYFLIGFALFALSFQMLGAADDAHTGFLQGAARRDSDAAAIEAVWKMLTHAQWLIIGLVLPACAQALRIAYRRHAPDFAEMWVFSLYIGGHALGIGSVLLLLDEWAGLPGAAPAILLLPPAWLVFACFGYFTGTWWQRAWRAGLALVLAAALTLLFLFAAMAGVATMGRLLAAA